MPRASVSSDGLPGMPASRPHAARGAPHASGRNRTVLMKALISILLVASVAGCNTIAGAGKDIERGGQVIRDTAKDVQRKM
jgi:predicted small secreted protein